MGRAIDMENLISALEGRVKKIEDALAKVIETVDAMQEKTSKVKPVNLTSKKEKTKKEKKNAIKEKADDEGNGSSNK